MTQYRLAAIEFVQVLERNEKGQVTKHHRYRQGDLIELSGSEEARLLRAGALLPLADVAPDDPVAAPDPGPVTDPDDEGDPDSDDEDVKRPRKAGPVDEWRAYAVSKGIVQTDEAAELTKAELIELVGEG